MYTADQLLSDKFDSDAFLRYALHSSSPATEQSRVASCLEQVRADMQALLADRADGLVGQLQASSAAQRSVATARESATSLLRATDRLRLMIEEPYTSIQGRVAEMGNANAAVERLRDVLRFLSLTTRLCDMMGEARGAASSSSSSSPLDIGRAARTLKELEDLLATADIRGIEVVEGRIGTVERFSAVVRGRVHELLAVQELLRDDTAAAAGHSRTAMHMSTALQCSYTLGTLTKVVHTFMVERKREALRCLMRDLDSQAIDAAAQRAAGGRGGGQEQLQHTQNALLAGIRAALYATVQQTQAALLLWRLLLLRRDALTDAPLFAAVEAPGQILREFWCAVTEKLRERLVALQRRPDFEAALTAGYPQYRQLLGGLVSSSGDLAGAPASLLLLASSTSAAATAPSQSSAAESAVSALLLHLPTWALGDFVDLMQAVAALAPPPTAAGRTPPPPPPTAAGVEAEWVHSVAGGLQQRFAALLADRHRERIARVLAKVAAITPATAAVGAQPVAVSPADTRRGGPPPQACALDLSAYTKLALEDCLLYAADPAALTVAVGCVVASVQQLLARVRAATSKHPLPPLPATTAAVSRGQLMHLCIANASTALLDDLTRIVALVQEAAAAAATPDALQQQQQQLHDLVEAFSQVSERATLPFLHSARETLLPTVAHCVAVAAGAGGGGAPTTDSRALLQLRARLEAFAAQFHVLVDRRAPGWADATRHLSDSLLAHLLGQCAAEALAGPPRGEDGVRQLDRALVACLQEAAILLVGFASATQGQAGGGVGRGTLALKGAAKQTELFYSAIGSRSSPAGERLGEEARAALRPLHPLLARLLLLQQAALLQQQPPLPLPAPLADAAAIVACVEAELLQRYSAAAPPPPPSEQQQQPSAVVGTGNGGLAAAELERAVVEHLSALLGDGGAPATGLRAVLRGVWQTL